MVGKDWLDSGSSRDTLKVHTREHAVAVEPVEVTLSVELKGIGAIPDILPAQELLRNSALEVARLRGKCGVNRGKVALEVSGRW